MKKYIITLLILAVTVSSCDNRLDTFPTSEVATEEAFNNDGAFTNAIRGSYLQMLGCNTIHLYSKMQIAILEHLHRLLLWG
jgi:hypothetical protein